MKKQKTGFTLIELLVVIAIIALLLSIVLPGFRRAKFIAKRVVCASQMKQGVTALLCYADPKLPRGAMPKGGANGEEEIKKGLSWSQLDWIHEASWLPVTSYLKDTRAMICPAMVPIYRKKYSEPVGNGDRFEGEPFIVNRDNWTAYKLGYNYHGGHYAQFWPARMNNSPWVSPEKTSDSGVLPLLSCFINKSNSRDKTFIAHAPGGTLEGEVKQLPSEIPGSKGSGGNVGHLDGSVAWKPLEKMEEHLRAKAYGTTLQIEPGSTILTGYW